MDPELVALASTAAITVVKLLTTDGWEKAKKGLGTLWRRVQPERAERIEAAVSDSRQDLLTAKERGEAEQEAVTQWDSRLRTLLAAEPDAADLLCELLERELRPALIAIPGPQTTINTTTVRADARDHGQSFAAGGNMTVHTRQIP
jgi:hypothetical protein